VVAVAGVTGDAPLPAPAAAEVGGEAPLLAPEVVPDVAEPAAYVAWSWNCLTWMMRLPLTQSCGIYAQQTTMHVDECVNVT